MEGDRVRWRTMIPKPLLQSFDQEAPVRKRLKTATDARESEEEEKKDKKAAGAVGARERVEKYNFHSSKPNTGLLTRTVKGKSVLRTQLELVVRGMLLKNGDTSLEY